MPNTLTFNDVDAGKWTEIKQKVHSEVGLTIGSDSGETSVKGITFAWEYDAGSATLHLTVEKTSWYDPSEASIDKQIENWISSIK